MRIIFSLLLVKHQNHDQMMKTFLVSTLIWGMLAVCPAAWADDAGGGSLQVLQEPAEQADLREINKLGEAYYNGNGVQMDEQKAFNLFLQAAERGLAEAQFNLGECYITGSGVNRDLAKAIHWYTKAAEQKLPAAMDALAMCYFTGVMVPRDDAKGMAYLQAALDANYPRATFTLGMCYNEGLGGLPCNFHKAKELYEIALAKGVEDARDALLFLHNKDDEATNKLKNDKQELLESLVDQDVPDVHFSMAVQLLCSNGNGAGTLEKAADLFIRAAEKGHVLAQVYIAACYHDGIGVEPDSEKTLYWLKKADEQGNVLAKLLIAALGTQEYNSQAVDLEQLENELIALAKCGDRFYQVLLGSYYYEDEDIERRKLSVPWLEAAAKQNVNIAQYYLGVCYYKGVLTEKNEKKAIQYWRQAASQGFTKAQLNLLDYFQNIKGQKEIDKEEAEMLREKLNKKDVLAPDMEVKSNAITGVMTMIYDMLIFVFGSFTGIA